MQVRKRTASSPTPSSPPRSNNTAGTCGGAAPNPDRRAPAPGVTEIRDWLASSSPRSFDDAALKRSPRVPLRDAVLALETRSADRGTSSTEVILMRATIAAVLDRTALALARRVRTLEDAGRVQAKFDATQPFVSNVSAQLGGVPAIQRALDSKLEAARQAIGGARFHLAVPDLAPAADALEHAARATDDAEVLFQRAMNGRELGSSEAIEACRLIRQASEVTLSVLALFGPPGAATFAKVAPVLAEAAGALEASADDQAVDFRGLATSAATKAFMLAAGDRMASSLLTPAVRGALGEALERSANDVLKKVVEAGVRGTLESALDLARGRPLTLAEVEANVLERLRDPKTLVELLAKALVHGNDLRAAAVLP